MNPLISVIIPVYKVEQYLHECVDSVLSQTYRNLEVILVDDGSPDSCPQICDNYAKADSRIKVLHKPNGGLSDARNAGIDKASGEYIMFLDSDDYWIGSTSLEKLVETLRENQDVDIIFFGRTTFIGNQIFPTKQLDPTKFNGKSKTEALTSALADGAFVASACLKLIRLSLIRDNKLYFKKGLLSEDWDWSISLYMQAKNFAAIPDNFYGYRKRKGSITQSFSVKHAKDILYIIVKWSDQLPHTEEMKPFWGFLAYIFSCSLACIGVLPKKERGILGEFKPYQYLLSYDTNPKVNRVNTLYKIVGYSLMCKILGLYLNRRPQRLR